VTRAFVALAPPDAQRAQLGAYLERCRAAAPEFRWVAPESVHLTLRFLGRVDAPALADLSGRLRALRRPPFPLRLAGLGTFGGRRPSVIWLGLAEGVEPAAMLARAVEAECAAVGLEPEPRPFRPHLTLARARERSGAPLPDLPPSPELAPWTATEMILFESRLGGGPPVYTPLERFALEADRS
jgi:RNA 2',3'-cyclic 3'-phosphodiesterase